MKEQPKKIKIIKVTAEDLQEKEASVPFTKRFVPIESTHKIRTKYHEEGDIKVYSLELVDKKYTLIQRIHVGKNDSNIKSIEKKLLALGLRKKVVKEGMKEFYKKYHV